MFSRSPYTQIMFSAAEKAARGLLRDFGELENLQVSKKGLKGFVSAADQRSEKILINELSKARPAYNFLNEESGAINRSDSPFCWIIDPLDGTTNFLHGIPHFAISLALKKNNEILAALTYDPVKDECFSAEKGEGAFLNHRRLRVSGRFELHQSIVGVGSSFDSQTHTLHKKIIDLSQKVSGIRRFGATTLDLAYVAAGRYDAFIAEKCKTWDIASGLLLVQEAGGRVINHIEDNKSPLETGDVLASNSHLSSSLLSYFRSK